MTRPGSIARWRARCEARWAGSESFSGDARANVARAPIIPRHFAPRTASAGARAGARRSVPRSSAHRVEVGQQADRAGDEDGNQHVAERPALLAAIGRAGDLE